MGRREDMQNRVLIIPAAGKSSRFPNMRPKWMLTHPDGKTMIEKVVENVSKGEFDKIYITILDEHCEKYDADVFLDQAFAGYKGLEYIVIDSTNSPAETIYKTLVEADISNALITIKDSDGLVDMDYKQEYPYVAGLKISPDSTIRQLQNKSFLEVNDSGYIKNIVEKKIISDIICVGVYSVYSNDFKRFYLELSEFCDDEIYVSDIVLSIITNTVSYITHIEAKSLVDWGTLEEWEKEKDKYQTYFCDIDGVIVQNYAKYGVKNWGNTTEFIESNVIKLLELQKSGSKIVLTSSRPEYSIKELIEKMVERYGFERMDFIADCTHSHRVVINDFAASNKYPSCSAVSIPRNGNLKDYL